MEYCIYCDKPLAETECVRSTEDQASTEGSETYVDRSRQAE